MTAAAIPVSRGQTSIQRAYIYVVALYGMIAIGVLRIAMGAMPAPIPPPVAFDAGGVQPFALFLILRAFASGSSGHTGRRT